jgi:hypothetical protein
MADLVNVIEGDLDDAATVATLAGADNLGNHVQGGLNISNETYSGTGSFDLSQGKCFILLPSMYADQHGHTFLWALITVQLDARTVDLAGSGVNHIYVWADFRTPDSPKVKVNQTGDAPTTTDLDGNRVQDSLKIAEIDTSESETTLFNEHPDARFSDILTDTLSIRDSITWPGGITTYGPPLTTDSDLDNYNAYYDVNASDPLGVVNEASYAERAGSADTAGSAGSADTAADSDRLAGDTKQDIIDQAVAQAPRGEWGDPIDTFEHSDRSTPLDWEWTTQGTDDGPFDTYRVDIQTENHNDFLSGGNLNVNDDYSGHYYNTTENKFTGEGDTKSQDHWGSGGTHARNQAFESAIIACPTSVDAPRNKGPMLGMNYRATGAFTNFTTNGKLENPNRDHNRVRTIAFTSRQADMTGRIWLYGMNQPPIE